MAVYPQTKSYFSHWSSTAPGSAPVRKHGITIMTGVVDAVSKLDNLKEGLLSLSELHAFMLRVDPVNFKVHTIFIIIIVIIQLEFFGSCLVQDDERVAAMVLT